MTRGEICKPIPYLLGAERAHVVQEDDFTDAEGALVPLISDLDRLQEHLAQLFVDLSVDGEEAGRGVEEDVFVRFRRCFEVQWWECSEIDDQNDIGGGENLVVDLEP